VSPLVVSEAEDGDPEAARQRIQSIEGIPALAVSDEARSLAHLLVASGPIPQRYAEDALHIALCAVNGIDYLVTWNCTHLANATLRRAVERVVEHAGYQCPIICTVEELMEV
jgi:predicted nucleic acid-binding protein